MREIRDGKNVLGYVGRGVDRTKFTAIKAGRYVGTYATDAAAEAAVRGTASNIQPDALATVSATVPQPAPTVSAAPAYRPRAKAPALTEEERIAELNKLAVAMDAKHDPVAALIIDNAKGDGSSPATCALRLMNAGLSAKDEAGWRSGWADSAEVRQVYLTADHYVADRRWQLEQQRRRGAA